MIEVPYESINFVWVSNHYDFHREGICMHEGKIARFECIEDFPPDWGTCDEDCQGCPKCDDYPIACTIHPLTPIQRLNWMRRKKAFELMVGHHWTYPNRRNGSSFKTRRPRWLYALLMALYYRRWRAAWTVFYKWPKARAS